MSTRDELYRLFSPNLLEAITLIIKDEINILRVEAGLPERTTQQLINAIKDKLDNAEDFDYQKNYESQLELAEQQARELTLE